MTETDVRLQDLKERLGAAHERIRKAPETGPGIYGAPDPETGERWNAGNVLGHLAEMLPFWVDQVRGVLAGREELGRGVEGYERRRQGIDSGQTLTEAELRKRVAAGVDEARTLFDEMTPPDLQRGVTYRTRKDERSANLGELLDDLIVAHVEAHAKQLEELD